jgi:ribosomal protein S18 acetylase RimI-like enzyme
MSIEVRPFRRDDREQVTALVNAHVQAVVPGVSLSVNAVMSQLEREPGEFIVDPWVTERATLVAVERDRVVAAAHLLRYGTDEHVGESYRDAGEIRWLLCWRDAPFWPDTGAGDALARACIGHLEGWNVGRLYADGTLPAPGVYGVPECWPHVRAIYERAGFVLDGHTEIVFVASVDGLPQPKASPVEGLSLRRELGVNGTRFSAVLGNEVVGFIEVETDHTNGGTLSRLAGWADVGNLHVSEDYRHAGVATWLVGEAAEWLRTGRVERLLAYAEPEHEDDIALYEGLGFRELTRTERGWVKKA